jgi:SAM-dependent methyltransferase
MLTQEIDQAKAEELSTRLFMNTIGAVDLISVYIGDRLGLYRAIEDRPATPPELAERAGIHPRYAREWLEQQAVTGILEVDDAARSAEERRYTLSPSYAAVVIDLDSPFSTAPLAQGLVVVAQALPRVLEAYRTGGGVGWSDFGRELAEMQGNFNRPWLLSDFTTSYLPSIADVHARLQSDPPARVLDVACGVAWSSIAIARAYPKVTVDALDLDAASIEIARENVERNGLGDRVRVQLRDARDPEMSASYDLAIIIEAVHDLAQPVEVLAGIRNLLAPGGSVIVADERANDVFSAPGDEVERLLYGFSLVLCLPGEMAEQPSVATGTVMRASTLEGYARDAGFARVDVLDIEHPFLRFYRLFP